ncbi:hypothetical protein [Pedosphaera parvula]|uniref:Uncharacterized protein n=1 Tax=Pedosphaera parvula (strain Ellin514) TaxID=320771 RepID=B9XLZ5_PEDPL|nr:hypothetical protein [Pedosphaera parvula]EEF59123.1 hypothetical protein Cflav_PD1615 [Pedosphaera parvula Ellin514]
MSVRLTWLVGCVESVLRMRFYKLSEIPIGSDDQVFKVPSRGGFIWVSLYFGIGMALLWFGISGAKIYGLKIPRGLFFYGGAAICGLLGRAAWWNWRARLKPTNWLLRCNGSGVIIKYRSYENWRFPAEDVQAVGFDYSEVAEIRKSRERRDAPSLGGSRRNQTQEELTFLVFHLVNTDTSALEAHLQAEQKAEPPNGRWKFWDYPVEVLPGGIVQVRWSFSAGYTIHPSLDTAIEYIGRYVKTGVAESSKVDLTYRKNLTPEEADANILKLAKSGDKLGAVKLTRQVYGSTLSEAVEFVERLEVGG